VVAAAVAALSQGSRVYTYIYMMIDVTSKTLSIDSDSDSRLGHWAALKAKSTTPHTTRMRFAYSHARSAAWPNSCLPLTPPRRSLSLSSALDSRRVSGLRGRRR